MTYFNVVYEYFKESVDIICVPDYVAVRMESPQKIKQYVLLKEWGQQI